MGSLLSWHPWTCLGCFGEGGGGGGESEASELVLRCGNAVEEAQAFEPGGMDVRAVIDHWAVNLDILMAYLSIHFFDASIRIC